MSSHSSQYRDSDRSKNFFARRLRPRIAAGLIGLSLLAGHAPLVAAQTKVIGYVPAYRGLRATVDRVDLGKVTHLNLSFLNPDGNGTIASAGTPVCMRGPNDANVGPDELRYVVNRAHQSGVKVLVSMAGGGIPPCSGDWAVLLQPARRQTLIDNLVRFVDDYALDGLDVDIEGELLTAIDSAGNYTPFVRSLDQAMNARGKLLTAATDSYNGGMVPIASLPYFDFVNIMSYDGIYGSRVGSEHSDYAKAVADIDTWKKRGLSKAKLVLGVPFYGYGFGSYAGAYTFPQIVNQLGGSPNADLIGRACNGCSYVTYNGLPTIRAKTRLALQEGSGVMIWELSQDGTGALSLLSAIKSEIGGGGTCPAWVSGRNYYTGDIVLYNGVKYIAEHDNPGYIPDVSTYFWEPTDAPC